ncbi:hypothetical protein RA19_23245 [Leisingera sp. ANG-M1]|uniref:aldolase n=1 Tax=Leisingera sp. ANG-M1 TaxID=1577895 RepID=UPI00057C698C|nr:aldolase [Leisingera sp. ANG-M1]KIC07696.1 hypothetical protein RA19_23245 [Leisingera sp. ANG-M1]
MAHKLASSAAPQRINIDLEKDDIGNARIDLAASFRAAAQMGLEEGICNHFSAVVPGHSNLFLVNPYGLAFEEIKASDLLICDFEGNVVSGVGKPEATAFYIHAELHRRKPKAKAAFHTHMPYATAMTMTKGEPLLWAGQTALKFYGRTCVDHNYRGLALDTDEGTRIAEATGEADIIFMAHHGVMILAETIAEAWDDLYYLERACQVQHLALSSGRKITPVSEAIAEATAKQMRAEDAESARLHLASIKRRLDKTASDFRN